MRARTLLPALSLAVLAGVSATSCAAPRASGTPGAAVGGAHSNCADQFATAMATKSAVKGTWDCLGVPVQDQFRSVGVEGDGGIARLAAKEPIYTREHFLGRLSDGGYIYSMSGVSTGAVLVVWLDNGGRIVDLQTAGHSSQASGG